MPSLGVRPSAGAVDVDRFRADRANAWAELATLVAREPRRLSAAEVLHLSRLHRLASADLALARRRWPGESVIPALEGLVAKGHLTLYGVAVPRRERIRSWLMTGYWQSIWAVRGYVVVALATLVAAALAGAAWVAADPVAGGRLVPVELRRTIVDGEWRMPIGALPALIGFAAGAAGMVGAGVVLIWVGAVLGATVMIAVDAGYGSTAAAAVLVGLPSLLALVVITGIGLQAGAALFRLANGGWRAAFARAATVMVTSLPLLVVGAALVELTPTPPDGAAVMAAVSIAGAWCLGAVTRGREA